jgi:hypothetical protein
MGNKTGPAAATGSHHAEAHPVPLLPPSMQSPSCPVSGPLCAPLRHPPALQLWAPEGHSAPSHCSDHVWGARGVSDHQWLHLCAEPSHRRRGCTRRSMAGKSEPQAPCRQEQWGDKIPSECRNMSKAGAATTTSSAGTAGLLPGCHTGCMPNISVSTTMTCRCHPVDARLCTQLHMIFCHK